MFSSYKSKTVQKKERKILSKLDCWFLHIRHCINYSEYIHKEVQLIGGGGEVSPGKLGGGPPLGKLGAQEERAGTF